MNIIQQCIDLIGAKTYLEIGVRNGDSFLPIRCDTKIGVDIVIQNALSPYGIFYEMSSDEYFKTQATHFDVAYIDGDHTYEQSLKDALNCLKWMNPNGIILMHDCNPTKAEWATPKFIEFTCPDWCGEVWKTILSLRTDPDLYVCVLDDGVGTGIIRKDKQIPLVYSPEQIQNMTYQDLEMNREHFLNLVKSV